jgi:hypothetical protein
MGQEGEGGVGGEYDRECLFDDDRDDDKYNDNNEYNNVEDGNGSRGERMMGGNPTMTVTMSSAGRPLATWGIGHRSLAPTPPPLSSTTTTTMIAAAMGGASCPPLRSIPSHLTPLVVADVTDHG